MKIETFSGGLAQTNAFLIESEEGSWLIDAPEGSAGFLDKQQVELKGLILTHGHWDHIWDAAQIVDHFKCPCIAHKDDEILFSDPNVMSRFGLPVKLKAVEISQYIEEGEVFSIGSHEFEILHLPGHCPGSIGLYEPKEGLVFGGDVLFAGGIGRTDLPGGDLDVLMNSIHEKLLKLPEATVVYPGHGPSTTLGNEKRTNPFLLGRMSN
ncbi:MAG: MBL fold metallo-hydrolase [Verrucomicrobiota bacterium]